MEFEQCRGRCVESGEEEEKGLSLRYLVTENAGLSVKWESSSTSSNSNHHDAFFEFALTTACKSCPAQEEEELFYQDCIFPWRTQSTQPFSCSKSKSEHENRRLLHEKPDAWRTDSPTTQSGYRSTFISSNSQASQKRGFHSSSETFLQRGKSTFQPDRTAKPPHLARKTRLKWLQFFSGGLITTPPLNLKQGKPKSSHYGLENSVFKRSVSEEGLVRWGKEVKDVNLEQRSVSVKEGKESIVSKGLKILTPVINCLSGSGEGRSRGNKMDKNPVNSKKGGARVHPSLLVRARKRSRWIFPI
ncbi:hypothetical protein SUGI_0905050 [Cryptomeria japonica]|nr:hypothetical protein SUGI_0905050 [Cryptomeria japonica]